MITYWSKLPISTEKGTKKEAGHSQSNQLNHFFLRKLRLYLAEIIQQQLQSQQEQLRCHRELKQQKQSLLQQH
ncbi:MAG: hypothetical protein K2H57_11530, partial [Duncaniella sp.]|nr:hypothetical protein [Duncaniella sp.]